MGVNTYLRHHRLLHPDRRRHPLRRYRSSFRRSRCRILHRHRNLRRRHLASLHLTVRRQISPVAEGQYAVLKFKGLDERLPRPGGRQD